MGTREPVDAMELAPGTVEATSKPDTDGLSRRNIMAALAGSIGVGALVASCGSEERTVETADGFTNGTATCGPLNVSWAATMESLRASFGPRADEDQRERVTILLGYHEPGDGHGGIYYWDRGSTEEDDGSRVVGSTTVSGDGRWKRIDYQCADDTFHVRDFGAVGDGVSDDTQAILGAIRAASATGGGTVKGRPGDTYRLTQDITISTSNIILDWQWATLTGGHRFVFDGDSGVHGDRSSALRNVHFKNAYFRSVNNEHTPKGPKLVWCDDSSIENVIKEGPTGTAFNVHMCQRCRVSNVVNKGGSGTPGRGAIGLLIFHSTRTIVENVSIDGDGHTFAYGVQVKGGYDNIVRSSVVRGSVARAQTRARVGFRDRGDAPWRASSSRCTYPYIPSHVGPGENPWAAADPRRASHGTTFIDCIVQESDGIGFLSQESTETTFERCTSLDAGRIGFSVARAGNGLEEKARLIRCVALRPRQIGIRVRGEASTSLYPDVTLDGCRVEGAGVSGIRCENTIRTKIYRCVVMNSGQRPSRYPFGVYAQAVNNYLEITNCTIVDTQARPTQVKGILIDNGAVHPRIESCLVVDNEVAQIENNAVSGVVTNNIVTRTNR